MTRRHLATLALAALALSSSTAGAAAPRWRFDVTIADVARGQADVEMTLAGFTDAPRVCAWMEGAEKFVEKLRRVDGDRERALTRDDDCWTVAARASGPIKLRYRYDLAGLADDSGDPDWAARHGGDFVFGDRALLLHPDPLPDDGAIEVTFHLPSGVAVAAPWERDPGPLPRFHLGAGQYRTGGYVAVGKLHAAGAVDARGGSYVLTVFDGPRKPSDEDLRAFVGEAGRLVADFYGEVPGGRAHVVLVPVPGSSDGGIFGSTLRGRLPSVVLLFGAESTRADLMGGWVATHELFHLGNPMLRHRRPWLTEGMTTYYQDVLRGRAGVRPAAEMWGDLWDGFRRFCAPLRGASLLDESRHLGERHHYQRVYWGGACLAFQLDVAIRRRSGGKQSLDTVLRALRTRSLGGVLDEDEVIAALDEAAGASLARTQLEATQAPPFEKLLRELGVVPTGDDAVRFDDTAPSSSLRKSIF